MNQLGFPSEVTALEVTRETSLGGSIALCARAAGMEPKQIQTDLSLDKAQWSRWTSNAEGIVWPKLRGLMDLCGNDAPVLWMNHDRGFDLRAMRRRETELEARLRTLTEENAALRRVLLGGGAT